ncbi:hypothetical protein HHK36_017911 [Tetracentron sinense]|uniref:DNA-directed RNA polymerase n=1 Tax=Tetracentron sinense TaxID=13715 RepID=A0A834YYP6_TETSI|nr:hypothetical protein HHK36_017911 [Tetracentron sinense]
MWRIIAKQASFRKLKFSHDSSSLLPACSFLGFPHESILQAKTRAFEPKNPVRFGYSDMGFSCIGELSSREDGIGRPRLSFFGNSISFSGLFNQQKGYASVAEAISLTDAEEDVPVVDEIEGFSDEMGLEGKRDFDLSEQKQPKMVGGMGQWKYQMLRRKQVKIETEAWEQASKEYTELLMDMCEQKLAPNLPYMKSLFLGWFEPLRDCIAKEQELCKQGKNRAAYAPYFNQLPAEMMSVITMHKLMALMMTGGEHGSVRLVQAACHIGEAIEHEVRIHNFLEKTRKKTDKDKKNGGGKSDPVTKEQEKLRKKVTNFIKKQKLHQVRQIVKGQDNLKPWDQDAQAKVGSRLIELLIQTAYLQPPIDQLADGPPDIRPAFKHTVKTLTKEGQKFSRKYGVIECDPLICKGLERTAKHMVIPYVPMLVPPVSWTGFDKGAHLFLPSYVMRTHGSKQQREAIKRTPRKQLEPVFEALDALGNTKWRVNKRVLSIIDRIWATGGRLAELVDREDVPLPEKPDTEDETELSKWKWKIKALKKENSERHSQRCDVELKLAVARKMKDEDGFFYPHNLDFRGRAYPMHPYLNHLGSDLCRGILEFAEGRPLGKSGLRWLKIHLANLYAGGVDKLSYEDRIAFTENHLDDIFDSADRPFDGRRWWLGAEDPFQCLAACINVSEALRSSSPETTISHMPIHQIILSFEIDPRFCLFYSVSRMVRVTACNTMPPLEGTKFQSKAVSSLLGAAAVNLVGGEKPADVYSGIASRVLDIMQRDAENDAATDPNALRASVLINQIDRKLVKQTVMTSVYGVTYIGARDQIKRRLKERDFIADDNELFGASCYAAKTTLTALGEMFEAARSIMGWLGDCAKVCLHLLVIASENQPVKWITPLGLPVVQPYRKLGSHLIRTSLQVLTLKQETDKVMVKKQRTAFPPNFVHSLDGSHMMMTAVACNKAGLNFAGVHDSYWTHACDVDDMNRILRVKFVELYETPILENLLESFQQSFPNLAFPPLPERGDFDLRDVLESPYFFN